MNYAVVTTKEKTYTLRTNYAGTYTLGTKVYGDEVIRVLLNEAGEIVASVPEGAQVEIHHGENQQ